MQHVSRKSTLPFTALTSVMAILVAMTSLPAYAADGVSNIAITPSSNSFTIAPGGTVNKSYSIVNNGDSAFTANISTAPFRVEGDSYQQEFTQLPGTTDASKWVKPSQATYTVNPSQQVEVPYTVTVPPATVPGGYYAVIFSEATPNDSGAGGVLPHNKVGSILYMTVSGTVKQGGGVSNVPLNFFNFRNSLPISLKVENTGGTHFLSRISVTVKDQSGKQVYSLQDDRYILPQTERLISTSWTASSPAGIYTISRSATVNGTVTKLPDVTVVLVQPWTLKIIALVIFAIIIAFAIRHFLHKRRRGGTVHIKRGR